MIAEFLNKPSSDELISRIAEQCTFKAMMRNLNRFTVSNEQELLPFLRKGVVGDWKNYFTPELNERFEKEVMAKLNGIGLEIEI